MYVIKTKNGLLNGFYGNDLPTTRKLYFNEKKGKLEPKFTVRGMMNCSGGYMFFDTEQDAQEQINYIMSNVEESRERYESVLEGSTEQLLKIISGFKVVSIK